MMSRVLKVNGGHVAYAAAGSGPAVICIPSMLRRDPVPRQQARRLRPTLRGAEIHQQRFFTMLTRDDALVTMRLKMEATDDSGARSLI
jgi:hypothetical protein